MGHHFLWEFWECCLVSASEKCATLTATGSFSNGPCSHQGKCLSVYDAGFTHIVAHVLVFWSSWFSGRCAAVTSFLYLIAPSFSAMCDYAHRLNDPPTPHPPS